MPDKSRKVVLITGASSGIGFECARKLIESRRVVYCAAPNTPEMKELADAGGKLLEMDLTKAEDIQRGVDRLIQEQGCIDVLINNAGVAVYGSAEEVDLNEARRGFEVNFFGMARLAQVVLPYMRRDKHGLILNMSSGAAKFNCPMGAYYHATKHAVEGWSDCLRLEVEPLGIDVVKLRLGGVKTAIGGLLVESTMRFSGTGPYAAMARAVKKDVEKRYSHPRGMSSPDVIAKTVLKIINTRRPKTCYYSGKYARASVLLRSLLGERMFDRLMRRLVIPTTRDAG